MEVLQKFKIREFFERRSTVWLCHNWCAGWQVWQEGICITMICNTNAILPCKFHYELFREGPKRTPVFADYAFQLSDVITPPMFRHYQQMFDSIH